MSEYWKSTPNYWCKHCSTYVRDTKLERSNHEASAKHQGNLKRFLRDIHRGHEREQREKSRAKAEVARLNGVSIPNALTSSSSHGHMPMARKHEMRQATPAERKQQLAQLAEMGVALPDEFRGEMALPGEWQVVSEKIIADSADTSDKKMDAVALGVRKRNVDDEDEEDEDAKEVKKTRWERAVWQHPPSEDDGDLDALLSGDLMKMSDAVVKSEPDTENQMRVKAEPDAEDLATGAEGSADTKSADGADAGIKMENSDGSPHHSNANLKSSDLTVERGGPAVPAAAFKFKKRKATHIRQR